MSTQGFMQQIQMHFLKVSEGVEKDVLTETATIPKGFPPPTMVPMEQLPTTQQHRLDSYNDQCGSQDNKEGSRVGIVVLVYPQRTDNEVDVNVDGTEGKDRCYKHVQHSITMPRLTRHQHIIWNVLIWLVLMLLVLSPLLGTTSSPDSISDKRNVHDRK